MARKPLPARARKTTPKPARPRGSDAGTTLAKARTASTAAARHADSLIALIVRRKQRITEDFFEIGQALRELSHRKLYAALGFHAFSELLQARAVMGRTQAFKLIQVATAFTRDQALALGLEKAFALITYAAATPVHEAPQLILGEGKIEGRPIDKLSVREIVDAADERRARAKSAKPLGPAEREARRAARAWAARLRAEGLHGAQVLVTHVGGEIVLEARVPVAVVEATLAKPSRKKRSDV